jgi:hypothetical protein
MPTYDGSARSWVAAGKESNTVQTYIDRAGRYVRWLEGQYDPRARQLLRRR